MSTDRSKSQNPKHKLDGEWTGGANGFLPRIHGSPIYYSYAVSTLKMLTTALLPVPRLKKKKLNLYTLYLDLFRIFTTEGVLDF